MLRYIEKIIVPFVNVRRAELKLPMSQHALAIFKCFKSQTTSFAKGNSSKLLREIIYVSMNKPLKAEMKTQF